MQRVSEEELAKYLKDSKGTLTLADNEPGLVWPIECMYATQVHELASDLRDARARIAELEGERRGALLALKTALNWLLTIHPKEQYEREELVSLLEDIDEIIHGGEPRADSSVVNPMESREET